MNMSQTQKLLMFSTSSGSPSYRFSPKITMGTPKHIKETKMRIMKYFISESVFSSSNIKKAVFSNSLSQSKNLIKIMLLATEAVTLIMSIVMKSNGPKLAKIMSAVRSKPMTSTQFQTILKYSLSPEARSYCVSL